MTMGVVLLGHEPGVYGSISPTTATGIADSSLVNSKGQPAVEAYISVETNPVRFRVDGVAPTATEGHLLGAGEKITIRGHTALKNLVFIDTVDGPSKVRITILF